jgi:cell division inhibitor SulA
MFNAQRQQTTTSPAGITELVLAAQNHDQHASLLPMLAHLSRQAGDRWFTWILPQGSLRGLTPDVLEDSGFDLSRLRLIHTRSTEETLWVLWQALALGNSEAVLASPGKLSEKAFAELEEAAYTGSSQGLLIRYR